jgi:RNA polymerase sigma-70 factor, ECF subfamily
MRTITAPSRASEAEVFPTANQPSTPEATPRPWVPEPAKPKAGVPTPRVPNRAAEELYARHHEMVYRVCLKYLRNREEAREAAQETFLKSIRALPEFEGLSQTGTWIYRIAVNECLSRIESRRRDREKRERVGEEIALWNSFTDDNETFAGRLLQEVLSPIPKTTQNVVWLALGQGLTHAEIATTLGVSRVAVTRRIARFMKHAQAWRENLQATEA